MTEAEANEWFNRKWASVQGRDDVEEFEQVLRAGGGLTKVWYRSFGFDFMAETTMKVGKVYRKFHCVAATRERVLERLCEYLLEYQHPTGRFRTKGEMAVFYRRAEASS